MKTYLMSSMEARFMGSICNMWHKRLITGLLRYSGMGNTPAENKNKKNYLKSLKMSKKKLAEQEPLHLIFLNKVGTCSSSKGKVPQSRAYNITPQLQMSTSGPA